MTIDAGPAASPPEISPAAPATSSPAPPSWPWRRAALFPAIAAQLMALAVAAARL